MCGIVGFTGRENALPILIKGLYSLEYRGYDSAGIAAFTKEGLRVVKTRGRIANLEEKIREVGCDMECTCADEKNVVGTNRTVFRVDYASFHDRKNISLHAFSGNIRT